jgi:hypothetical protein
MFRARQPSKQLSMALVDMAVQRRLPIIPVRFTGGLPLEPLARGLDFPFEFAQQDILLGCPLLPDELLPLRSDQRAQRVLAAINETGDSLSRELPLRPNAELGQRVELRMCRTNVSQPAAVLTELLLLEPQRSQQTERILEALAGGVPVRGQDAESRYLDECRQQIFLS